MKKIFYLNTLIVALFAAMFVGCVSDGDETIALEYGSPKKVIVGRWILTDGSTTTLDGLKFTKNSVWEFFGDGTFEISGDDVTHRWELVGNSNDYDYSGGILLDGDRYDIISLSGDDDNHGRWILGKPDDNGGYKNQWELWKGDSGNDNNTDVPDDENHGGKGKLVKTIKVSIYDTSEVIQSVSFYYDNSNCVTSVMFTGNGEPIIGPEPEVDNGYIRLYYDMQETGDGRRLTLSCSGTGISGMEHYTPGYAMLNDKGFIEYDCLDVTAAELNTGDYDPVIYYYDSEGQTLSMGITGAHDYRKDFVWKNGDIQNGYGGNNEKYTYYSDYTNKANINLNKMFTQTYDEDIFALALCGYIGKKDTHLLKEVRGNGGLDYSLRYEFDKDGYPKTIIDTHYVYRIEYTK